MPSKVRLGELSRLQKGIVNKIKNKRANYATVRAVDGTTARIQIGSSPNLINNVPIIGDPQSISVGQVVAIRWDTAPGGRSETPSILSGAASDSQGAKSIGGLYGPDGTVIINGPSGLTLAPGGVQLSHLSFSPAMVGHTHTEILPGWAVDEDGALNSGETFIHPDGQISLGFEPDIMKLDSNHSTHRIWIGDLDPTLATFSVTKGGAIKSTAGTIATWTIGATQISADSGNAILDSAAPYISLGGPTAWMGATGFWVGKDGASYKMHLGSPLGSHIRWDGTDLITTGDLVVESTKTAVVGGRLLVAPSTVLTDAPASLGGGGITFRAYASADQASGSDITVTKPTGTVDDDVMIAQVYAEGNSGLNPSVRSSAGTSGTGTSASVTKPAGTVENDVLVAAVSAVSGSPGISYIGVESNTADGGTSIVVNVPAGVNDDDVLVAGVSLRGGGGRSIDTHASFTLIRNDSHTTTSTLITKSMVRVASSEPASYTFNVSGGSANISAFIIAFSGVDTTTPIDVHGGQENSSGTSVTAPTVTTTVDNCELIFIGNSNSNSTYTPPSGMTERVDQVAGTSNHCSQEGAHEALGTAGATGTRVATTTNSGTSVAQNIALKPASGGSLPTFTAPSGWTQIQNTQAHTGTQRLATYYKVAGGSEPASYAWTLSASAEYQAEIICVQDADDADPLDASSNNSGENTSIIGTGVTTGADRAMLLFFGSHQSAQTVTPPSGMSEERDNQGTAISQESATVVQASAGASGNKGATVSSSTKWMANLVSINALNPAGGIPTITAPGGWTQVLTETNTLRRFSVFRKVAATEGANYVFTFDYLIDDANAVISTYDGVDTTTPVEASNSQVNSSASTTLSIPGVTTLTDNAWILAMGAVWDTSTITVHASTTERYNVNSRGAGSTQTITPAGATGSRDATLGTSRASFGAMVALKPAGAGWEIEVETALSDGDIVHLQARGQEEWMEILDAGTGAGPYTHAVTRDLGSDGLGTWLEYDVVVNTGQNGDGFIDMFAGSEIGPTVSIGPTIRGNVRFGTAYDDFRPFWEIGNLIGSYGYVANTYGAAFGQYATDEPNITIDSTNGFRIRNYSTVLGHWDASGNLSLGEVATNQANLHWDNTTKRLQFRGGTNGTDVNSYIDTDGSLNFVLESGVENFILLKNTTPVTVGEIGGLYNSSLGVTWGYLQTFAPAGDNYAETIIGATGPSAGDEAALVAHADATTTATYIQIRSNSNVLKLTNTKATLDNDLHVDVDVRVGGGVWVGGTGTDPDADDVHFEGNLKSNKGATDYDVYAYHPLDTPLTSTSWDGDSFSTVSKVTRGVIDMSSVFSAPTIPIKAYRAYVAVRDSGSAAGSFVGLVLHGTSTADVGTFVTCDGLPNDKWERADVIINADANGDIYIQTEATGTDTLEVFIQILGYFV